MREGVLFRFSWDLQHYRQVTWHCTVKAMKTELLPVDRGRLLCPLRGEIDVEQCVSCADEVRPLVAARGEVTAIECRARRPRLRQALAGATIPGISILGS